MKGRKLHLALDTLGHLLAAIIGLADAQDRVVAAELCAEMQAEVTGNRDGGLRRSGLHRGVARG